MRDALRRARSELRVLVTALRHPRTPWLAKVLAVLVVAYALSPIDLIPDPIPVLGLLDDALLVPLGVLVVRRLVPDDVLDECRAHPRDAPAWARRLGVTLVIATWFATIALLWWWLR